MITHLWLRHTLATYTTSGRNRAAEPPDTKGDGGAGTSRGAARADRPTNPPN